MKIRWLIAYSRMMHSASAVNVIQLVVLTTNVPQ